MKLLEIVKLLDGQPNATRRELITEHFDALGVPYTAQRYATGTNLVVDLGRAGRKIGVGAHFDRVPASAGANDNGSAVAVGLDIIRRHQAVGSAASVRVFFFDEEETGLHGSQAYVDKYGVGDMACSTWSWWAWAIPSPCGPWPPTRGRCSLVWRW